MNLKSKLPLRFQKYASFGIIPKILFLPFAVFSVVLIFIFRPFVIIQIYPLDWQIGHLIPMSHANELRNKTWNNNHRRKKISIYCINGPIASRYAIHKLRESALCSWGNFAWLLINITKFVPKTRIYFAGDINSGTNYDSTPLIKFNQSEIELGSNLIETYKPMVCLNVRDTAYNSFARHELGFPASDWTHRNSDIGTYLDAARYLTKHGYSVFRMGARAEKAIASDDPKIVDYAKNGLRSEFLDFYLAHECHFVVSTSSGWDEIPTIFNRPLLLVNHFDFLMTLFKNCVVYPKLFFEKFSGRLLSLSEIVELHLSGKTNQKKYSLQEFGIEVRDLSSEEIVAAVTEMVRRVEGAFVETPEQKELQLKIRQIIRSHPKLSLSLNNFPIRSTFAACFLDRYPSFCN